MPDWQATGPPGRSGPGNSQSDPIILGRVVRAHGVHGAVVVTPYTDGPDAILNGRALFLVPPPPLDLPVQPVLSLKGKAAAQGLIVKFKHVTTRQAAEALRGWSLALWRRDLPGPAEGEVYLADLMGLAVFTVEGGLVGRVENFMETGDLLLAVRADDGREILVPFHFVLEADPARGHLVIDPPPGLLELQSVPQARRHVT